MKLSLIRLKDAEELLAFELANQVWFEQFIPPREPDFYTKSGVEQHIREFLLDYQCNELLPLLIKDENDRIIGRLNVTNIDTIRCTAHLGYRVGQGSTKQGVAKGAVAEVVKMLRAKGIKTLFAYAATSNPASQKVLTNNRFQPIKLIHEYAELNGESIDCIEFKRLID
ncbi:GCN5 family acetyltransferase [Vibrio tubiashii]|nr:GCN5 family acetyltransferase [Vibrio tubiashii]